LSEVSNKIILERLLSLLISLSIRKDVTEVKDEGILSLPPGNHWPSRV
jgi:hypothetical protein